MAELDTVANYITASRRLLQDTIVPYRYPDADIVSALNTGFFEVRRLRPDLLLPVKFVIPTFSTGTPGAAVALDPMYRQSLVYYIVGMMQLRDDEQNTDARAASLLNKFVAQMLKIES